MTTSKSPKTVLMLAYETGKAALRRYAHRFSPMKFTQPQLFACLVLKVFLRLTYRGLSALLSDTPDLCQTIGLGCVPHYTTFQKASCRLLKHRRAKRLLQQTVRSAVASHLVPPMVSLAAMDSTGLESHHASAYYVRRLGKGGKHEQNTTYTRFPKLALVCETRSHLILAAVPGQGPGPDILHFRKALEQSLNSVGIQTIAADAGYDSEATHQYARVQHHVRTLIPATIGRPTTKRPSGYWRAQMKSRLHLTRYSQRWQVETAASMLKRLLTSELTARTYWSCCREMFLMAITLNVMILAKFYCRSNVFYRARLSPFSSRKKRGDGCGPDRRAGRALHEICGHAHCGES